jgi:succinoglycan biosynthesis transport protein ExoP
VTLSDYLTAIKRGWIIILTAFVLAMVCATALVLGRSDSTVYTVSARLYVETVAAAADTGDPSPNLDFTMNRVASYAAVLGGNVVGEQVSESLGGRDDESVSVSAPVGTVIVEITVTSGKAERAAEVARAYVDIAPSVIEDLDRIRGDQPRVEVTTLDEPGDPVAVPGSSPIPVLAAGAVLGLGLGFTIVMVREVLRRERAEARVTAQTGQA